MAPGTCGTIASIAVYAAIQNIGAYGYALFTLLLFILGTYVSSVVSKDLGQEDYSGIVIDEFVGFLITMWLVPVSIFWVLLGFILFRFFDVWKPFPIRQIEKKVKGGLGVMLDDVVAGFMAWIVLQCILILGA